MKELLVATGNRGKLEEFRALLDGHVEHLYSLADFPQMPQVVEDGVTFVANASKKALAAAKFSGMPALADDSGLVVELLNGRPGVWSARYAGDHATDTQNNEKLLLELSEIPSDQRRAAFHCVIALCLPDGNCRTFDGALSGVILQEPRGSGGFGYDPLFLVPEYGKTLAELPMEVKNRISHRGRAMALLRQELLAAGGA
ncbi:MAG TPA: XTP/dITP diphosphatase [Geobacterales bacterium]|nr:XTP/dITP diphosphatase [Geobacterales bacterium]